MDHLDRIRTPVLIISGADDQLTPPKYSDYLERNIAGSRLVRIADAGHLVPVEKPEAVNQALLSFMETLSASP